MFHSQYDFKPVFSLPSSISSQRNDAVEVSSKEDNFKQHTPDKISQTLHHFHKLDLHLNSPAPSPIFIRKPSFTSKPLIEASNDDIFGSDTDLDHEADFADDELESDYEGDEDYDTLDSSSGIRFICEFLDPYDSDSDCDEDDFDDFEDF